MEETLEIERRKLSSIFHGVPDIDANGDIDSVEDKIGKGLHYGFG